MSEAPSTVHIHAPQPTSAWASEVHNCPARASDGRRCGGRRMVVTFTPWYGLEFTCYHCGARYGDDGIRVSGRADVRRVRARWHALFEAGETSANPRELWGDQS